MGFKTVQSSFAKPWAPNPGDSVIGVYKGIERIPSDKKKDQPFFNSYRIGELEKEVIAEDGTKVRTFGISGAMLASKFNQIPKGARVKITYAGKQKVGKGMAKMFDVEVDDDVELLDPDTAPESDREPGSDDGDETPFH